MPGVNERPDARAHHPIEQRHSSATVSYHCANTRLAVGLLVQLHGGDGLLQAGVQEAQPTKVVARRDGARCEEKAAQRCRL